MCTRNQCFFSLCMASYQQIKQNQESKSTKEDSRPEQISMITSAIEFRAAL